jgi:hypothetical protein
VQDAQQEFNDLFHWIPSPPEAEDGLRCKPR